MTTHGFHSRRPTTPHRRVGCQPRHGRTDLRRLRPRRLRHGRLDLPARPHPDRPGDPGAWPARWAATRWSACWSARCSPARVGDVLGRRKVMLCRLRLVLGRHGRHRADDHRDRRSGRCGSSPASASARWWPPPARSSRSSPRPGRRTSATPSPTRGCRFGSLLAALLAILLLAAHRLARHVLDRRAADRHTAAAGLLQDARVGGLAGLPRPAWRGPGDLRADRGPAGRGRTRRLPVSRARSTEGGSGSPDCSAAATCSPTILLGLMSVTGLVLVYSLNTWLPELMMRAGFSPRARCRSCSCSTAARCSARWSGPGSRTGSGPSRWSPRAS